MKKEKKILKSSENIKKSFFLIDIFRDISLLFKFFLNWNISKLYVYIASILLGFFLSFPFFFLYKISGGLAFIDIYTSLFSAISLNSFDSFFMNIIYLYQSFAYVFVLLLTLDFSNIIFLIGGVFFVFSFLYSSFVLIKISKSYLEGKKISIKEINFLNYKSIIKFFSLTFINLFILLLPLLLFIILTGVLILFSGNLSELNTLVASNSKNYFSIISFIFLIISIIFAIYLYFRIIFSYFILLDDLEFKKSIFTCIKESFLKTKGLNLFFKFLSILFLFFVLILPFKFIGYILIKVGMGFSIYSIIFSFVVFLLLYGLSIMIFTSFYNREVKNNLIIKEKKGEY